MRKFEESRSLSGLAVVVAARTVVAAEAGALAKMSAEEECMQALAAASPRFDVGAEVECFGSAYSFEEPSWQRGPVLTGKSAPHPCLAC